MAPPVPPPGIYCPSVTFFHPPTPSTPTQALDLPKQEAYYHYLTHRTPLTGLIIHGTTGEPNHLTTPEQTTLLHLARRTAGPHYPLIAGVSAPTIPQVLSKLHTACSAGANYALLLPPAHARTPTAVFTFLSTIATHTPLPLILYNFPAATGGGPTDLSARTIAALHAAHPRTIVGVKLTCGSIAKLTRLTTLLPDRGAFATFAGQSDWLLPGLRAGGAGAVSAFSNVFPKSVCEVYRLWEEGKGEEEAERLQRVVALAEEPIKAGVAVVKAAVAEFSAVAAGVGEGAVEALGSRATGEEVGVEVRAEVRRVMAELSEVERRL